MSKLSNTLYSMHLDIQSIPLKPYLDWSVLLIAACVADNKIDQSPFFTIMPQFNPAVNIIELNQTFKPMVLRYVA